MSIVGLPVTLIAGVGIIKFGPSKLYVFAYSLMMLCPGGFSLCIKFRHLIPSRRWLFWPGYIRSVAVLEFTPWNVFPFIPDIDEMVSRQRREGLFAAVMTFSRKTTVAIATFCGAVITEWRLCEGQPDTAGGGHSYHRNVDVHRYCGLTHLALWQALTFHLNKRTHKIFVDELDRLKANGSPQLVSAEARRVVEDLTGYSDRLCREPAGRSGAEPARNLV